MIHKTGTTIKENKASEVTNSTTEHNKKKKPKFLVGLNTFLCFIVIIIASSALILNMCGREILIEQTLEESVKQIDEKSLSAFIQTYVTDSRIDEKNIQNILSKTDVMEFVCENIGSYSNYLLSGEEFEPLTADVVIEFIEENKEIIRKETGLKFVEADKEHIRKEIEKPLADFNSKLENNVSMINSTFSLPFMILMVVVLVFVFVQWCIIYVKNSVSLIRLFKLYGIALLIPSFIFGVAALFLKPILKVALPDKFSFITDITQELRSTILLNVGILIIIALAMITISITLTMISEASEAIKVKKATKLATAGSNEIQQNKEVVSSAGLGNNHTVAENSQAIAENSKETTNNNQALEKTIQNEAHVDEIAQVEDSESEPEGNNEKIYKFCTECGNKLMKNAIFCAKCGKKMN